MTKIKELPARLKSCPDTKLAESEFFSGLLSQVPEMPMETTGPI
jgi:hypothetical protein